MATHTIRTRTAEVAPPIGSGLRDKLSSVTDTVAGVFKLYFGPAMTIERVGQSTKDKALLDAELSGGLAPLARGMKTDRGLGNPGPLVVVRVKRRPVRAFRVSGGVRPSPDSPSRFGLPILGIKQTTVCLMTDARRGADTNSMPILHPPLFDWFGGNMGRRSCRRPRFRMWNRATASAEVQTSPTWQGAGRITRSWNLQFPDQMDEPMAAARLISAVPHLIRSQTRLHVRDREGDCQSAHHSRAAATSCMLRFR